MYWGTPLKKILILLTLIIATLVTGCGKKESVEKVEDGKIEETALDHFPFAGRRVIKYDIGKFEGNALNFDDIGTTEPFRENSEIIDAEIEYISIKINKGTVYKTEVNKGVEIPEFAEAIIAEDGNIYQGCLDFELEFNPEKIEELSELQVDIIDSKDEENFGFLNISMEEDKKEEGKLTGLIVFQLSGPEVQTKSISFKKGLTAIQVEYQL